MFAQLREFAARQDFNAFLDAYVAESLPSELVRGVHVGVDFHWLDAWLVEWSRRTTPWYAALWSDKAANVRWLSTYAPDFGYDLDFRPRDWNHHCRARGYPEGGHPIYIKIILRREFKDVQEFNLLRQWNGHPILYEVRPPCRALSALANILGPGGARLAPGESIGLGGGHAAGTAGGFLRDTNSGKSYLLSCAHVLPSDPHNQTVFYPSPQDSGTPTPVADVWFSRQPPASGPGANCNRVAAPQAEMLDLAAAELYDNVSIDPEIPQVGPVAALNQIVNLNPRDEVLFVGRTSGRREARLTSLSVWDKVDILGQTCCLRDLFVMSHRPPYYLNTSLARGGDSGAWVVNVLNNVVGWDGMLIADDGAQAYGCFAENIQDELSAYFPHAQFVLLP